MTNGSDLLQRLLASACLKGVRLSIRGGQVGWDDLADAFAAVWTAARIIAGKAERFPETDALDAEGLPMHIWA